MTARPGRPANINRPGQVCLYLPQDMIDWLKDQPEGASAFVRIMVGKEMRKLPTDGYGNNIVAVEGGYIATVTVPLNSVWGVVNYDVPHFLSQEEADENGDV